MSAPYEYSPEDQQVYFNRQGPVMAVHPVGLSADVWALGEPDRSEAEPTDEAAILAASVAMLKSKWETLNLRTQYVLEARFGLRGYPPMTLQEIGETLGITRERVRQLESDGLGKLRKTYEAAESDEDEPSPSRTESAPSTRSSAQDTEAMIRQWREELWARQENGEKVYVTGSLLKRYTLMEWPPYDEK